MSPAEGERRLNSATAPKPGRESASANLTWLLQTRPEPGAGRGFGRRASCGHLRLRKRHELVEPRRCGPGADRLPGANDSLLQALGVPGRGDAACGVENHRRAVTAVRAGEHLPQRRGVRPSVTAAQLLRVGAFDAELQWVELVLADSSAGHFANQVRAAGRELVD